MLSPPAPPLDDGTIRLEPLGPSHLEGMDALGRDSEVARFTYVPVPFTTAAARSWLDRYLVGWEEGTRAGFAIHASGGDEFLGFIALISFDPDAAETEIGYIVAPGARGRGVAKSALKLVCGWALGTLGLARLELRIDVENVGSVRVAEGLGFVREGVLRSVHFKQGMRVDLAVYSLLPSDLNGG
jgi:RimJ/RimL family protein N-acetyltransferase